MLFLQETCKIVLIIYLLTQFTQWEEQHINLTCEDFAAWKKDNDPKLQEQGLAAYLNERGIGKF